MTSYSYKELAGNRLLLRKLKEKDASAIFSLRSHPEVNRYLDRVPQKQIEEANAFIETINKGIDEDKSYYWAITQKDNDELIGTICLWNLSENQKKGEIGYELLPAFQGQGFMKEAIKLVLEFAFTGLQMEKIEAYSHKNNLSSNKLLSHFQFSQTDRKDPDNEQILIYNLFRH